MQNINLLDKLVIRENLCSGCGTCAGVCPKECIKIGEKGIVEFVDYNKCVYCDLCYRCCPSGIVEFKKRSELSDQEIGPYSSIFRGHACSEEVRKNGASGGMATAILQYMLDYRIVDCIVCANFTGQDAGYRIVNNSNELLKNQKSYYIPISLNLAIREIKEHNKKYAIIGTPCQIQGLVKAAEAFPFLGERIKVKIGLFCGYIQRKESIEALARYLDCDKDEWDFCGWRCGEYPGYASFKNKYTKEIRKMIIYDALSLAVPFYTLRKCFLCPDGTNEYADIALGDVHAAGVDENVGIVRTEMGKKILAAAMGHGYVCYKEEIEKGAMFNVIKGVTTAKRRLVLEQLTLDKKNGKRVPEYLNIDMRHNSNIIIRMLLRRKAQLYCWSSSEKGRDALKSMSQQKSMEIGKYIYQYPNSSYWYRIICKLSSRLRKKK